MKATCAMLPRATGNEQQEFNKSGASLLDSSRALRVDDIDVLASLMGLEAGFIFICSARKVHTPSRGISISISIISSNRETRQTSGPHIPCYFPTAYYTFARSIAVRISGVMPNLMLKIEARWLKV